MAESIAPNATDLRELADRCDLAAAAIVNEAAAPIPAGPRNQATSAAVAEGHTLVQAVSAEFARQLRTLGDAARQAPRTARS